MDEIEKLIKRMKDDYSPRTLASSWDFTRCVEAISMVYVRCKDLEMKLNDNLEKMKRLEEETKAIRDMFQKNTVEIVDRGELPIPKINWDAPVKNTKNDIKSDTK